ncbi:MAG: hypothetical protein RR285_00280 [Acinetobacter sp.]
MTLSKSYIDIAEASAILADTVGSESWVSLTDQEKQASLIQSTFLLDSSFDWSGTISTNEQELRWPRAGVYDRDDRLIPSDIIPNQIKQATALMALHLSQAGGISSVSNNVKSIKVGPISIGLDSEESIDPQIIPRFIISILSSFGDYEGPSSSDSAYNVRAYR